MPIKGCGVDMIEIKRIARALQKKRFRQRIYTCWEQKHLKNKKAQSWAARFAAKEAVMKALGFGWGQGASFRDIEIAVNERGRPEVRLQGQTLELAQKLGVAKLLLSLSHTKELAAAYVIAIGEE
ncbi:MAG: holo-ACP synthase [Firmicutes bacterium]|nr:holo-ACP synthase [Bacillota bacterium]